jgi:SPP1 gp7 family putative phage head morphogenesis protein
MVDGFLTHLESEIAITKSFQNKDKDYFSDNEDDLLVAAQLDFTPLLLDQAVLAGNEALRLISSKDIYTPSFRKQIAENVAKFTQSMIDTDRDTLINIITQGLQNGHSIPDIRKEITDTFDSISKNQAQRITRTEVLRVSNQAALDAWEQSGVVEGKQWLTAGAVDECADYEGDIVYDLGGNFYSDITEFKDGDPPLHPNCRCVVLPILVGEKGYVAQSNKAMRARIIELESQIDKRTKAYREIKELKADGEIYIKRLEAALNKED